MSRRTAQDVLQCHLCETLAPPMYCDICDNYLCKACVGEHLSDESKEHKVVLFKMRGLNPKCSEHPTRLCDLYCKQCDIPVCFECVSSRDHLGHDLVGILKILYTKKEVFQRDLQELENFVYPKYKEIASYIKAEKADLNKKCKVFITAINKHGEDLHREIDIAINKLKSDVDDMGSKLLVILNKQQNEIKRSVSEITQSIAYLKRLLKSNDLSLVSGYESKNAEFQRLPPKVSLPRFAPRKIDQELIYQLFGSLSGLSIKIEKNGYTMDSNSPKAESSFKERPFIDVPTIITDINTDYRKASPLCSVSCLGDDEVWTSGQSNYMRLYSLNGKLVNTILTKSRNTPASIAVAHSGELLYTDYNYRTVNIVKKFQEEETVIRLEGWKPRGVCSSSSGDFLVVMITDDQKQTKVVRYTGTTEKNTFQYGDDGQPLYSHNLFFSIVENKNLDICVADFEVCAVVVVNQAGKHRFTYTGHSITTKHPFGPACITTDSQSRILTADINNDCIHINDKNGQFLRYIDNCHLQCPTGVCVDANDCLFVAEAKTCIVKKIKYYV